MTATPPPVEPQPGPPPADHDTRPVVVGADGSEHSLAAVDLAADEAARRGLPLEILHSFTPPLTARPGPVPGAFVPNLPAMPPAPELDDEALREQATTLLHEAAERARAAHPDLPVVSRLRDGYPTEVLVDASRQANLLVVGHRGLGGFAELVAGSVASQLPAHAACPVIVVRGEPRPAATRPVVIGVDGSEGSRRAAEFAAAAAARYQVPLDAVYAWTAPAAWRPELVQVGQPPPDVPPAVSELIATLSDRHPELAVRPDVIRDQPPHQALVARSAEARLVVVGSRGRGGFRGLLLGSTSQALIHHSHCPVAVIGPEAVPSGHTP